MIIPGIGLYCASKIALESATEATYYETTGQGIDLALIEPTAFNTEINRNAVKICRTITLPALIRRRPEGEQHYRDFLRRLENAFSGNPTRDPQEVADLAIDIARTPSALRTLRYPVGDSSETVPVEATNEYLREQQRAALQQSGYSNLFR